MARDAVERCLERLAEAVRKIGDRFDAEAPAGVDLQAVRQFGSVLRHDYDHVDPVRIWRVVVDDVPSLKTFFAMLQERYPFEPDTDFGFNPF